MPLFRVSNYRKRNIGVTTECSLISTVGYIAYRQRLLLVGLPQANVLMFAFDVYTIYGL